MRRKGRRCEATGRGVGVCRVGRSRNQTLVNRRVGGIVTALD